MKARTKLLIVISSSAVALLATLAGMAPQASQPQAGAFRTRFQPQLPATAQIGSTRELRPVEIPGAPAAAGQARCEPSRRGGPP